jgi:two-component system NtrC family sensor kinase
VPSIRRKIGLGFLGFVLMTGFLSLFAYSDLRYLERRIESGIAVYRFFDAILELRLHEKNHLLAGAGEDLTAALQFGRKARGIFDAERTAFAALLSQAQLDAAATLLDTHLQQLSAASSTGSAAAQRLPATVRDSGHRLTELAERLARSEREELSRAVSRSQWALLASVAFVALAGWWLGHRLVHLSLRPLGWLETQLQAISDGRYQPPEPVSQDQEVISMSRAVKRMLADIETRNRRLLQTEKLASLGTLASGMAHELNNPLSNISSSCQILMEDLTQGTAAQPMEWLEQIDGETERAKNIVRAVLDFSRDSPLETKPHDLRKIIEQSLLLTGTRTNTEMRLPAEICQVEVDGQKLQQVFINLLQNALDAGGPQVQIRIRVACHRDANFLIPARMVTGTRHATENAKEGVLVIEVCDNGPGIPAHVLPRIFDPFFTTRDVGHGTGLGLYVSQQIIDLHGGCIGAESPPEGGSRFLICLPRTLACA